MYLRGNCTPNQKMTCFALYFKTVNTFFFFLKMMYTLYIHLKANCPRNSKKKKKKKLKKKLLESYYAKQFSVMDQNSQNIVLINNSRTTWIT